MINLESELIIYRSTERIEICQTCKDIEDKLLSYGSDWIVSHRYHCLRIYSKLGHLLNIVS